MLKSTARNSDRSAKQHACGRIELSALAEICVPSQPPNRDSLQRVRADVGEVGGARCSTAENTLRVRLDACR
jgi:hypothetical protein